MRLRSRLSARAFAAAAAIGVPCALAATAHAQDQTPPKSALEEAVFTLESDEVVVTAERPYATPLAWSGGRTTITPQDVAEAGVNTMQDLLMRTPGFAMGDESNTDSKPNFGVRGISPQRSGGMAMLIDGVPMAPAPYAHPGLSLFPFMVERAYAVDIYRGGYSVRYGPNNVAGVINFLTRPIPKKPMFEEKVKIGSDALFSAYTAAGGTFGEFGVLVEDVHRRGDTFRENGEFRIDSQSIKSSWQPTDTFRAVLQLESYDDDSNMAGGFDDASWAVHDREDTVTKYDKFDGRQDRANIRLIWEPGKDEHWELHAFKYGGHRTFRQGSPSWYGDTEPAFYGDNDRRQTVWAIQALHTGPVAVLGCENALTLGGRYQDEWFVDRPTRHPWPRGPEELRGNKRFDYHVVTLFAEHDIRPLAGLTVHPGVRLENVSMRGRDVFQNPEVVRAENFSEVLPAISASYELTPEWAVFAAWQSTYKPPQYSSWNFAEPEQELSSERAQTREIGTRGRFLDGAVSPELTWFFIDYRDKLEADPLRDDVVYNVGRQENSGTEFRTDVDLGKLDEAMAGFGVYGGWTHLKVRYLTGDLEGNEGAGAPPDTYIWGARWRWGGGFRAGLDGLHVTEHFSDAANSDPPSNGQGLIPERTLWSARVGFDGTFMEGRCRAGVELGVTNLFDEEYFDRNGNKGIVPGQSRQMYLQFLVSFDF